MAKKNSGANANESAVSRPAQPKTDRRMTSRQRASGNVEAVVARQDGVQEAPEAIGRQATPDVAQDPGPAPRSQESESTPPEPSEAQIRLRAYLRYLERGAGHGADFDDWLQAEMELKKR